MTSIEKVQSFWEKNPLWTGESQYPLATVPFFEEHRTVYIKDCFAGRFDIRFLPPPRSHGQAMRILDLGCGIGFWVTEFAMRGFVDLEAVDLTEQALEITARRLEAYGVKARLSQQNAEDLQFENCSFDHINCQGVIHHTPNTEKAVAEIARLLKPCGTASISVYFRNSILKSWPYLRWVGWPLAKLGAGLRGRGREKIFLEKDIDEIVRLYDGSENPVGKSYTRKQFVEMLSSHFIVEETYLHFFPARTLPFKIPTGLHRWLDNNFGFMIFATVRKPCVD